MSPSIDVAESQGDLVPLCSIITPIGMLGYGFDEALTDEALAELTQGPAPVALIMDSGSTDSGPAKLALGVMTCPRSSYQRDLEKLLKLAHKYNVPIMIGSAGGDGAGEHVDEFLDIIKDIIDGPEGSHYKTKVVALYSDIPKELVKERLGTGKIKGCGPPVPTLTEENIDAAPRIVAQMGVEPYLDAMYASPDFNIMVGGRAYDPAPYVAFAAYHAMGSQQLPLDTLGAEKLGAFFHLGKILECGGICATPKSRSAYGTIYVDGSFKITPLEKGARCTPLTVAAHTLYEKTRPDLLEGPGGTLDLTQTTYAALPDGKSVLARGALFHSTAVEGIPYTIKLEAAKTRGYRSLFMGHMGDPVLTGQIDSFLARVQEYVKSQHRHVTEEWELGMHKYGALSPPGQIFVVGEALATNQKLATSVASAARIACTHGSYPGQKQTSGSLGFGIGGKLELETGPCAEFCIYHVMDLQPGEERGRKIGDGDQPNRPSAPLFPWQTLQVGEVDAPPPKKTVSEDAPQVQKVNGVVQSSTVTSNGLKQSSGSQVGHQFTTIGEVAQVVRSKNAGPFEITLDLIFESPQVYQTVKRSGFLTEETVASLYSLRVEEIIFCGFFDQALAWKATIPRMTDGKYSTSGSFLDDDYHGSQKYSPLMNLKLPSALAEELGNMA
ncbi:hypothetical protein A1O1_02735 [Capronia coronata CBS 617.96]|uniref:Caib baif family enzyme n=1 Tax=Capronia coronata CBS 617.96 TaxID=1182541 RepID=W9YYK5_9EURO|nr:uncharacterized protein A1O1_02735 [Capronia coronata CBS 617.96]EXJ94341.1 hypothetical protein A1O1_02735 [Capronia coronata CBS 617.96]